MAPGLIALGGAALPLLLAAAGRWLPAWRWLAPGVALVSFGASATTVTPSAGALIAVLAAASWLAATVSDALDGAPAIRPAVMAGCIELATLLPGGALAMAAVGASLAAAPERPLVLLAAAALAVTGDALGLPVLAWAALAVVCLRPALAARPRGVAMLCGPLAGLWVMASLDVTPGLLLATGIAGLAVCAVRLRRGVVGMLVAAVALFAVASIGAGSPGAALLHVALGCLALIAAVSGGRAGLLGLAALAGVPPLGVAASAFSAIVQSAGQGLVAPVLLAPVLLAAGFLAVVVAAIPLLPRPAGPASAVGWVAIVLTLAGAWALPLPAAQFLAAAAR